MCPSALSLHCLTLTVRVLIAMGTGRRLQACIQTWTQCGLTCIGLKGYAQLPLQFVALRILYLHAVRLLSCATRLLSSYAL
jgi:hypothetical protein